MIPTRRVLGLAAALALAACNQAGASPTPAVTPTTAATATATTAATVCATVPAGSTDLLGAICARGTIKMSTDPAYAPQSVLAPDDPLGYKGFDIDVGKAIADGLGVNLAFETPDWTIITAGSWGGRWDFSVGSMTITTERQKHLWFTQPYYFTPAQMAVRSDSTITDLAGLAGKVICVGETTTYLDWINGTLDFGTESPQSAPPTGATATTLKTDRDCPVAWQAGRHDFDGWLTSSTTVQGAIADGLPVKAIGEPVFYEPLAAAFDKSSTADATALVAAADKILADMHADGRLSALSIKWFNVDLTVKTTP
jgi:polar amino acid transport system substrate-binding protein